MIVMIVMVGTGATRLSVFEPVGCGSTGNRSLLNEAAETGRYALYVGVVRATEVKA